jgi:hypothetical protein
VRNVWFCLGSGRDSFTLVLLLMTSSSTRRAREMRGVSVSCPAAAREPTSDSWTPASPGHALRPPERSPSAPTLIQTRGGTAGLAAEQSAVRRDWPQSSTVATTFSSSQTSTRPALVWPGGP